MTPRSCVHVVPEDAAGQRLDQWLSRVPDSPTRSQIKAAADDGRLLVGERAVRGSFRLRGGERVLLVEEDPVDERLSAEEIPLDILHEDEDLIAVNKPPGMVVHPAVGNRRGTLVNAILHRFPGAALPGRPERAGIVHRLDRDTSGVILVARSARAHEALARQFRERSVEKFYLAVVLGRVRGPGLIDLAIGRHPHDRKRMSTAARRARTAATDYEPLEVFAASTLLAVRPHTGRTHQIRVHLAAKGWPVVADPVYGRGALRNARWRGSVPAAERAALAGMPRQALHAAEITVVHPSTGRPLRLCAPLPADFETLLRGLRTAGNVVD